jgi:hypothetical protein
MRWRPLDILGLGLLLGFACKGRELADRAGDRDVALREAREVLAQYAVAHDLPAQGNLDRVGLEIVVNQAELVRDLPNSRPTTVALADCEHKIRVVPPDEYRRLIPEYFELRSDAWVRLVAHELAHCWIPDIDPTWLREGFAVIAADQGFDELAEVRDLDQALTPIDWDADRHAYATAAADVAFVLRRIPVAELLAHRTDADLEQWIRARLATERQSSRWPARRL